MTVWKHMIFPYLNRSVLVSCKVLNLGRMKHFLSLLVA